MTDEISQPDAEAKLAQIEQEIDEARRKAGLEPEDREPKFVDAGTVGTDVVDNDIAPPG